jgi:hypothetical protein
LSRRQLIFIDGLAFFMCSEASYREDLITEGINRFPLGFPGLSFAFDYFSRKGANQSAESSHLLEKYLRYVNSYMDRNLTYPDDILKAFSGMAMILEGNLSTSLLFGLPVSYFDAAVLWTQYGVKVERRTSFPSWSWSGWFGPINWDETLKWKEEMALYLSSHTWIEWEYFSLTQQRFVPLSHSIGEFSNHHLTMRAKYRQFHDHEDISERRFTPEVRDDIHNTTLSCPQGQAGQLKFATFSAFFQVAGAGNILKDCNGDIIGELHTDPTILQQMPNLLGIHEVLILSERLCEKSRRKPVADAFDTRTRHLETTSLDEQLEGIYGDVTSVRVQHQVVPEPWTWSLYNVMVIGWEGNIAHRLAVGWIYREAVADSFDPGYQWKEIILF